MAVSAAPTPAKSATSTSVNQLLDHELESASPATRLSTYSSLLKYVRKNVKNSILVDLVCSRTLPCLVTDLQETFSEEALSLSGTLLQVTNLDPSNLDKLISTISNGLRSTLDKALCRKGLWCLANVKLTNGPSIDTLNTLFETASYFLSKEASVQSVSVLHEACNILAHLGSHTDFLQGRISTLLKLLLPCLFHENENIRKISSDVLSGPLANSPICDVILSDLNLINDLKSLYIPQLHDMATRGVFDSLKLWEVVIKILGPSLLDSSMVATLNALLKIEEVLLKSSNLKLRHQALKSWKLIINLLTSSEKQRSSKNKLRLLTVPLKASESRHPSIAATKLELWWLLMNRLGGPVVTDRFEDTVLSFLTFCFGTEDPPSKGIADSSSSVAQDVVSALVCLLSPKEHESVNQFSRSEVLVTDEAFIKHRKELQLVSNRALKSLTLSECHLVKRLLEHLKARLDTAVELSAFRKSVLNWWFDQLKSQTDDSLTAGDDAIALFVEVCTESEEEPWSDLEKTLLGNIEICKTLILPLCIAFQTSGPSLQRRLALVLTRVLPVALKKDIEQNMETVLSLTVNCLKTFSSDPLRSVVISLKKAMESLRMQPADRSRFWEKLAEALDLRKLPDFQIIFPELAAGKTGRKKSDDDDFVVIATPPTKKTKRVLTEHQKEVLRSKRLLSSIPAMYNDYSQSNSQFIDSETTTQMETPPIAVDADEDAQAFAEMPISKSDASPERRCSSLPPLGCGDSPRRSPSRGSSLPSSCSKVPETDEENTASRRVDNIQSCDIFAETSFEKGRKSESLPEVKEIVSSEERTTESAADTSARDSVPANGVSPLSSAESAHESVVTQEWLLTQQWNLNSVNPVYPPLIRCEDRLEPLLCELAAPSWAAGIAEYLKSRGILTVGHLASLPELLVQQLPFKAPQCEKVRHVLDKFYTRGNQQHQSSNGKKPHLLILESSDESCPNLRVKLENYDGPEAFIKCTCLNEDRQSTEQEISVCLSPSTGWISSISRDKLLRPGLESRWKFTALTTSNDHLCETIYPDDSATVDSPRGCSPGYDNLRIVKFSPDQGVCRGGEEILILVENITRRDGGIQVKFFVDDVPEKEAWSVLVDCEVHQRCGVSFRTPPFQNQNILEPVAVKFQLVSIYGNSSSNACDFRFVPAPISVEGLASWPKETVQQAILDVLSSHPEGREILKEVIYRNLK